MSSPPNNPPVSAVERGATVVSVGVDEHSAKPFSWGAIFAGCFAALGVHILITMLGIGLGLRMINPLSDAEPIESFSIGAGIAWSVSALMALWIGGWIAGRSVHADDRGLGVVHGLVVWAVATVILFGFLTSGATQLATGAARVAGKGVAATAQGVGEATGGAAGWLAQLTANNPQVLTGFLDEIPAAGNDRTESGGREQPQQSGNDATGNVRGKAEVGVALIRFFANRNDQNRAGVVSALTQRAGVPPERAEQLVQGWERAYDQRMEAIRDVRTEVEREAREAAAAASKTISRAAVWTFVAFVLGAVSAALGARYGAKSAARSRGLALQS